VFAERQRGGHRQRRDDIQADIAAAQACDDLNDQHQQHRPGAGGPDPSGPRAAPGRQKGKAERQSRSWERNQERPQHRAEWCEVRHQPGNRTRSHSIPR
jgi:hypothetical protein